IDANGIVHVTAKDLGTGRAQDIRITASSGLSEEEIQKMVKEAEEHASQDQSRKETVEGRNQAESLVYSSEKMLGDVKESVSETDRQQVEDAIGKLKEALNGEDDGAIKSATEELTQASHVLAEALYKQSAAQQQAETEAGQDGNGGAPPEDERAKDDDDDVVDAEFEEVRDNK
ncbi:MAG: Hsp70 family protein, partial [bacterium]